MPYRVLTRGDYYRGDYYRGDPGLFSFIGNVFKTVGGGVLGALGGFAKGGIGGAIAGGIGGLAGGSRAAYESSVSAAGANPDVLAAGGSQSALGPGGPGGRRVMYPGGAPPPGVGIMGPGGGRGLMVTPGGGGGRVMRPSGKGYFTARHLHALQMGRTRAKPRMNPYNPQALRRASRRAHAFLRGVRKLVRYYVGKPHKGKPYIKARKR